MLLDIFLKCYVFIIFLKTTLLRYNLHILTFICVEYISPWFLSLYAELHGHHYNLAILHFLCTLQRSLRSLCGHCHSHFRPSPLFWRARHCVLSCPHGETEVSIARKNEAEIWTMSFGTPDFTNLLKLSEEIRVLFHGAWTPEEQRPTKGLWPLGCSPLRVPGGRRQQIHKMPPVKPGTYFND